MPPTVPNVEDRGPTRHSPLPRYSVIAGILRHPRTLYQIPDEDRHSDH